MSDPNGDHPEPSPAAAPQALDGGLAEYEFDSGVPQEVRRHGKAIDPDLLEPGDLLLVAKKQPSWLSRKIQAHQKKLYADVHARWHHAIVSGGGVEICEARVNGVQATHYWEYMTGEYDLKIRRLKSIGASDRSKVAYYAATMVKTVYGFGTILSLRSVFALRNPWRRSIFQSRGVICSQLFSEACYRIGVVLVPGNPTDRIAPAHLSASAQMEDIAIRWVKV